MIRASHLYSATKGFFTALFYCGQGEGHCELLALFFTKNVCIDSPSIENGLIASNTNYKEGNNSQS